MTTNTIIIHHRNGSMLHEVESTSLHDAIVRLAASGADLTGADLARADLTGANLSMADLARANLAEANLARADLTGANLSMADLARADLTGADLRGANLAEANLARADLRGANLRGANLRGADLRGARLNGSTLGDSEWTLIGERPLLFIGPIGSRSDYVSLWLTSHGPFVRAGCFFDSLTAFKSAVDKTHGTGIHGQEYCAAIELFEHHVRIFGQ